MCTLAPVIGVSINKTRTSALLLFEYDNYPNRIERQGRIDSGGLLTGLKSFILREPSHVDAGRVDEVDTRSRQKILGCLLY